MSHIKLFSFIHINRLIYNLSVIVFLLFFSTSSYAGPPFLTDDPEPVDYQHAELNFFTQATYSKNGTNSILPGVDANYGLFPNVQIHANLQMPNNETEGRNDLFGSQRSGHYGFGDTELGVKYRFVNEEENGWWPQIAVYPLLEIPTGNANKNLGAGHIQEFIPLWLQKDFGDSWQTYGGGGYWNNPGVSNSNYWFFGWALQRRITEDLTLGGELFHQTSNKTGQQDNTGFNLGGSYDLTDNYHLLFSAGQGIQNVTDTNQFSYYFALQWTF